MSVRQVFILVAVCLGLMVCFSLTVMALYPPVATFRGHTGRILAVVASLDGQSLASMSEDKTIKLWDVTTRRERATFPGGQAAFSLDGKTLASTVEEGDTIRVWDVATGEERAILRGQTGAVSSVALSPDGKMAASGSSDKSVKLWDVATGKVRSTHQGHTQAVTTVVFSPDGKTLASVSYETIKLWDVTADKERATLRKVGSPWSGTVYCVAFSPDGKTMASGHGAAMVKLWDAATGTTSATLDGDEYDMTSVVFSPDDKTLASLDDSDTINLWDIASGENVATSKKDRRPPRPRLLRYLWNILPDTDEKKRDVPLSIFLNSDGRLMAAGRDANDDTTVKVWKAAAVPKRKR